MWPLAWVWAWVCVVGVGEVAGRGYLLRDEIGVLRSLQSEFDAPIYYATSDWAPRTYQRRTYRESDAYGTHAQDSTDHGAHHGTDLQDHSQHRTHSTSHRTHSQESTPHRTHFASHRTHSQTPIPHRTYSHGSSPHRTYDRTSHASSHHSSFLVTHRTASDSTSSPRTEHTTPRNYITSRDYRLHNSRTQSHQGNLNNQYPGQDRTTHHSHTALNYNPSSASEYNISPPRPPTPEYTYRQSHTSEGQLSNTPSVTSEQLSPPRPAAESTWDERGGNRNASLDTRRTSWETQVIVVENTRDRNRGEDSRDEDRGENARRINEDRRNEDRGVEVTRRDEELRSYEDRRGEGRRITDEELRGDEDRRRIKDGRSGEDETSPEDRRSTENDNIPENRSNSLANSITADTNQRLPESSPEAPSPPQHSPVASHNTRPDETPDRHESCCGSVVPFDPRSAVSTGAFDRVAPGGSIKVVAIPPQDVDHYPPGKVRDLKVSAAGPSTINLTWTAPGDDLDHGTVSNYIIRLSPTVSNLQETQFNQAPDETLLDAEGDLRAAGVYQKPAGTKVGVRVLLPAWLQRGQPYYVALRALDDQGHQSPVSNLARFSIPEDSEDRQVTGTRHVPNRSPSHTSGGENEVDQDADRRESQEEIEVTRLLTASEGAVDPVEPTTSGPATIETIQTAPSSDEGDNEVTEGRDGDGESEGGEVEGRGRQRKNRRRKKKGKKNKRKGGKRRQGGRRQEGSWPSDMLGHIECNTVDGEEEGEISLCEARAALSLVITYFQQNGELGHLDYLWSAMQSLDQKMTPPWQRQRRSHRRNVNTSKRSISKRKRKRLSDGTKNNLIT